jgi:hypothetical protein
MYQRWKGVGDGDARKYFQNLRLLSGLFYFFLLLEPERHSRSHAQIRSRG